MYRLAIVVLVLGLGTIGCADSGSDGLAPNYCTSNSIAPSCITGPSPTPSAGFLTVPTEEIRLKLDADPSKDFPAVIQLMSISPLAGTLSNAPFRFSWNMRFRVDDIQQRGGIGVTYSLFPSNDGETRVGELFSGGYITTPGVDSFSPDGSPGMIFMMPVSFKYILVELRSFLNNGTGEIRAHYAFKVDYVR